MTATTSPDPDFGLGLCSAGPPNWPWLPAAMLAVSIVGAFVAAIIART